MIVGDGPLSPWLAAAMPDAVLTGPLAHGEVATALASAELLVSPNETATAVAAILEAQACGVPVLVTPAGGAAEAVVAGRTGYVCRAGDAADFAFRTSTLLHDVDLRRAMGCAARAFATTRRWASALEILFASYRDVAAASGRVPGHVEFARPWCGGHSRRVS
jgi:glycosyltransferase involved in cell wall biosynthesis